MGAVAPWLRPARCLPLLLVACAPAWANPALPASARGNEPAAWVERIRQAALQRSYTGTLVFTSGDVVSSSRVARFGSNDQVYEQIESLDGRQQRSIRQNGRVHTLWPAARVMTVEPRSAVDDSTGLPELEPRLQAHYEMRVLGVERLAGRDASVLMLRPRDDLRFAQRLWADQATGLLLRADVLSAQGQVLESSAFSNVEIDAKPPREGLALVGKRAEGYRVVQLASEAASLETEGWMLERLPAGFKLLGCVSRSLGDPLEGPAERLPRALQAVYSDGLARVSVFIEAADGGRPRQALMTQLGATHTLIKPRDNRWWVTVMGDVPMPTIRQFADALTRKP